MQKEIIVGFIILLTLTMIISPIYGQIPTREEAEKAYERFLVMEKESMPESYTIGLAKAIMKIRESPENKEEFIRLWIETQGGKINPELWLPLTIKWSSQNYELERETIFNNTSRKGIEWTEEEGKRITQLGYYAEILNAFTSPPPQSFFEKLRNETATTIEVEK